VETTAKSNNALTADTYTQLMEQSVETGRPTYRLPDPRLFDDIASQRIPPGPGPKLADNPAKQQPESGAASVR
jgi:cytochrome o ubiquinol oxidase subunit 2